MFGLELLFPWLLSTLGGGAAAAGTAAGAGAAGAAAGGGLLGGAGLGSLLPASVLEGMQGAGLLGKVVDATGGLETATNAANNVGGGLLGGMGKSMGGDSMMKLAQVGNAYAQSQQQPQMQAPQPGGLGQQSQQITPLARSTDKMAELRRKRLEMMMRGYQ